MASVNSPIRKFVKPILFRLLGKGGYKWMQFLAKKKDIQGRLVEEIEMELLPLLVGQQDEVLDIGANYAYYTERLSKLTPVGKVFAFEPIPFTHDVAAMLVKSLKLSNVSLYQKGVGQKTETLRFSVPKVEYGAFSAGQAHITGRNNDLIKGSEYFVTENNEEFDCEVVDIDSFLLPQLKKLTFVKIDIEGAEYFALKGMKKTLEKFKPAILIEIVPVFIKSFSIEIDFFKQYIEQVLGYKIYIYNPEQKLLQASVSLIQDRNYILLHATKLSDYKHLMDAKTICSLSNNKVKY